MTQPKEQQAATSEMVEREITPERYGPGTFGCHEALDRTSILMHQVYELVEHGAITLNDEWQAMALKAADTLFDLYQAIGAAHLDAPLPSSVGHPGAALAGETDSAAISDAANEERRHASKSEGSS
jgi:hypothetical protein